MITTENGVRQHDYKGFTIEPAVMGLACIIAIHGRKCTIYYTAKKPDYTTATRKEAMVFASSIRAHDAIDKIYQIHSKWLSNQMNNQMGDAFHSK